jgi:integrin alpha FG-GAP repeat containing protein 1
VDALVPVCYPAPNCSVENSLRLYFNAQKPLCNIGFWVKQDNCRLSTDLCEADPNFQLFETTPLILGPADLGYPDYQLFLDPIYGTLSVHQGDYNLDGYPDLLVPLANVSNPQKTTVHLFQNTIATSTKPFQRVIEGVAALDSIPNAFVATFFDFGDNVK